MKTISIRLLLVASCLLAAPSLRAQDAPSSKNDERFKKFLERVPESDLNKDGVLTRDEVEKYNAARRAGRPAQARSPDGNPPPTHADVKYGDHAKQAFDIWLADSTDGKPTPLAIYIHGGGFRGGDKKPGRIPIRNFLDAGISFASLNYRLTDGGAHPYPAAMHDSARGLQTIRSKAKEWNLDAEKVACFGGSAGAGISLWLAFHDDLADPDSADPVARQSTRIVAAGITGGQSTYDMRTFREWFGVPNLPPHEALVDFYAVKSDEDWESDRVIKLMEDASAIAHLTKDDKVPVFGSYCRGNVPVDEKTEQGAWVHHVLLGLKLKEAMDRLGIECVITDPENRSEKYADVHDFVIQKLTQR